MCAYTQIGIQNRKYLLLSLTWPNMKEANYAGNAKGKFKDKGLKKK